VGHTTNLSHPSATGSRIFARWPRRCRSHGRPRRTHARAIRLLRRVIGVWSRT